MCSPNRVIGAGKEFSLGRVHPKLYENMPQTVALRKILEAGQMQICEGNFCDAWEFFAEIDSEDTEPSPSNGDN